MILTQYYKPIMLQFFKKIGKELFNLKKIIIFKKVRKKQIKDDTRTFTTTERGPWCIIMWKTGYETAWTLQLNCMCVCDVCSESKQEKREMSRKMLKILAKAPGW